MSNCLRCPSCDLYTVYPENSYQCKNLYCQSNKELLEKVHRGLVKLRKERSALCSCCAGKYTNVNTEFGTTYRGGGILTGSCGEFKGWFHKKLSGHHLYCEASEMLNDYFNRTLGKEAK